MDIFQKFGRLLDRKAKRKIIWVSIVMTIGAFLETAAVMMIMPFISVISDTSIVEEPGLLRDIYLFLNVKDVTQFLIILSVAVIVIYVTKGIFLLLVYAMQYKFAYHQQQVMCCQLMETYLNQPYEYYLNKDTSEIIRAITTDIVYMFQLLILSLQFCTEVIVMIFMVIFLLTYTTWSMALIIGAALGISAFIVMKILKPRIKIASVDSQRFGAEVIKWTNQSILGAKDIKVSHKESFFLNVFTRSNINHVRAQRNGNMYSQVPRLFIETVCISAMMLYVIFALTSSDNTTAMFTQLSAFAVAAIRLMPSVNRMSGLMNSILFYKPSLDAVYRDLQMINEGADADNGLSQTGVPLVIKENIHLSDITFRYPNTDGDLFSNLNCTIPVGQSVAIIGPSGGGKTTLVDVLLGLLHPQGGHVLCDDVDIQSNYSGWLAQIGYIPQTIFMLDGTIRENVAFGMEPDQIDDEQVWQALKDAQLDEYIRQQPESLECKIGERGIRLSGGQRQRIGIARALYHNPEILVFDEATSALDNETEAAVMESIDFLQGKKTMIIIAHRLGTIKNCNMVYKLEHGQITRER